MESFTTDHELSWVWWHRISATKYVQTVKRGHSDVVDSASFCLEVQPLRRVAQHLSINLLVKGTAISATSREPHMPRHLG
jgi:hypothetical protein